MPKLLSPAQYRGLRAGRVRRPESRAVSPERALYYRRRLEAFEAAYPEIIRLKLDQKAHMICPWVDR